MSGFRWPRPIPTLLIVAAASALASCGVAREVRGSSPTTTSTTTEPSTTADSTPPASARGPIYLALGDSAPVWNGNDSYPNHIASYYSPSIPDLELVNLAQSGATTSSMLKGPNGGASSQQQQAGAFVHAHQGSIALITIDIGGNDILGCITSATSASTTCIQKAEATMVTNLDSILTGLRQAVGPSVRIVGMTYYDPFLGDWLAGGADRTAAVGSVSLLTQLNSLLSGAYEAAGAQVADVQNAFQSTDLSTTVASAWGQIPIAVEEACTLLDITCRAGQTEGFGDDPNPGGGEVIARAFESTIRLLKPPG